MNENLLGGTSMRVVLGAITFMCFNAAASFWQVRELEAYYGTFWPIWYGVAGVFNLALILRPHWRWAYFPASLMVVSGVLCRALASYFNYREFGRTSLWYVTNYTSFCVVFAMMLYGFYSRYVSPWCQKAYTERK